MQVCRVLARCVNKRQTLAVTALMVGLLALGGETAAADTGTRLQGGTAPTAGTSRVVSLNDDVATAVCAALKVPVTKGVNALIRVLSEGRYRGTLAGSIFSTVGFKPWCKEMYPRLESLLRSALNRRPDLRQESGSFVFDLRATAVPSTVYANSSFFMVLPCG